jgi:hypothetical protein
LLTQGVKQTGPDVFFAVGYDGEMLAEVKRYMASLAALGIKGDAYAGLAAQFPDPADKFTPVHTSSIVQKCSNFNGKSYKNVRFLGAE